LQTANSRLPTEIPHPLICSFFQNSLHLYLMHPYTNRLIHESSPYLLQHAHNPVDWYPWGQEAFEKASREDKPVLVSIGYAACHWCHVMERESFEKPEVAALMNEHFVNIKVDREERPDVDHIYMDAVQAITGSGGWPLNVFLTPDKKPFYGGTYFPPKRAFNRASWPDVLLSIAQAYREKKDELEQQAQTLTEHLKISASFGMAETVDNVFDPSKLDSAFGNVMKQADREWGGFGRAPKFPQTFTIYFLLDYAAVYNNKEALDQALLSLDKMIYGGIYDQAGGGFARYATDTEWLAPHFEKMLYDNALLVSTLSKAYQLTQNQMYQEVIIETLAFVERELMHPDGGFFSALDADSEGEEGKFYVWDLKEVEEVLQADAGIFSEYFDISEKGNWEEKNILRITKPMETFAQEKNIAPEVLKDLIKRGKEKLLERRAQRVRPALDDKILLSWNALMNTAYSRAFAATGEEHYREVAERNMEFLLQAYRGQDDLLFHSWKNGQARHPGFLDDYANLVAALIDLSQVTGAYSYLDKAKDLTRLVLEHFSDEQEILFYYTHKGQTDILIRKKELYDGATPSGNSMMAYNLYRLSILFDHPGWRSRSEAMIRQMGEVAVKYPTSFGVWLSLFFEIISGTREIAIIGKDWKNYLGKLLGIHISHNLVQASAKPLPGYPLLADKAETSEIRIYLCENYACRQPVNTIQDFVHLIQSK
jgi:uncharacterized protein YyaL (SSP411 family)